MKDAALKYHEAGLKVVPFMRKEDGEILFPCKVAPYRIEQTRQDIEELFSQPADGIAMLCTDGIEAIDIDVKHDPAGTIDDDWIDAVRGHESAKAALKRCVIQRTKNNGLHIIYRAATVQGNTKLAKRPGEKEHCIETRGMGGLLFVAPTPGYEIVLGDLMKLQTIADEDRKRFFRCAKEFNAPDAENVAISVRDKTIKDGEGKTPWDAFNENNDVLQMIEGYGWTVVNRHGDYIRLNRPGAKHSRGVDGSVIVSTNVFYPFSTSTPFEAERGFTPFGIYAVMEFGGDYSEAARDLYWKGYGDRKEKEVPQPAGKPAIGGKIEKLIKAVEKTRFDYDAPMEKEKSILKHINKDKEFSVGGFGQIGVITGHEKSGKSYFLSCLGASALSGGFQKLGFQLSLSGRRMIWFDTEQSRFFYQLTQRRIHWIAGVRSNMSYYQAYHLRPFTEEQRMAIINYYIASTANLGCIVIDGYVDLIRDYNSLEESKLIVNQLMKWTAEKNMLMLGVLHVNKTDGKIRGHLGSELKNKADFVINVRQTEKGIFEISNPTCRYKQFDSFTFSRDEDDMPVIEEKMAF